MKKIFFVMIVLFSNYTLVFSQDIKELINQRNADYSKINQLIFEIKLDSVPTNVKSYIELIEKTLEADNKIIDMCEERMIQATIDSTYVISLKKNLSDLQKEADTFREKETILFILAGLLLLSVILFFILFIIKSGKLKKMTKNYVIQEQFSETLKKDYEKILKEFEQKEERIKELNKIIEEKERNCQQMNEKIKNLENQLEKLKENSPSSETSQLSKREKIEICFSKIEKLKQLFDNGVITNEEFQNKKQSLLNEIENI